LKPVKNRPRELAGHRKVAEATFTKDSRINIRISSKDLRAAEAGAGRGHAVSDAGVERSAQIRRGTDGGAAG
jgi:hypothetical protein